MKKNVIRILVMIILTISVLCGACYADAIPLDYPGISNRQNTTVINATNVVNESEPLNIAPIVAAGIVVFAIVVIAVVALVNIRKKEDSNNKENVNEK